MKKQYPFCPMITPAFSGLHPRTRRCLEAYRQHMEGVHLEQDGSSNICSARNSLARLALAACPQAQGLFWIDADMVFTVEDCLKLLDDFAQVDKMISGIYVHRSEPHYLAAYLKADGPELLRMTTVQMNPLRAGCSLDPVGAVGLGFCITPRRFFEKMKYPWFGQPYELGDIGEDIAFCIRVGSQLKEEILIDKSVRIGHVGEKVYTLEDGVNPG